MGRGGTGAEQDTNLQTRTRPRPPPRRSAAQPAGAPAATVDETLPAVPNLLSQEPPHLRVRAAGGGHPPRARAQGAPGGPDRRRSGGPALPRLPLPADWAGRVGQNGDPRISG